MKHWVIAFIATLPASFTLLYFMGPGVFPISLAGIFFFFAASVIRKVSLDDQFDRRVALDLQTRPDRKG